MIIDYRNETVPTDVKADLCIIGAGAAGLAIARTFLGTPISVCVIESGGFSGRDVLALLVAGLRGGGWQGNAGDLLTVDIAGGTVGAAKAAAALLARAFALPGE